MNELLTKLMLPLLELFPALQPFAWALQGAVILILTAIISMLVSTILHRLVDGLRAKSTGWDKVILSAVQGPVRVLVWIVGITFSLEIAAGALDDIDLAMAEEFRSVSFILLIIWALMRLTSRVERHLTSASAGSSQVDRTTADALAKLFRLFILVMGTLVLLQNLGVSVSGILAFGGVGGLAVGFAAKDLLANFFGGLMIYMDRPFKVGDWIRSPDKDIEGTVESIGWRLTRIRTFDKRPLYVPNSTFANISVENPSRMTNRRINETVGVRYDDVRLVQQIVDDIREMLKNHPEMDARQAIIVNLNHFGPSSLDILVYGYTRTTEWIKYHEIKQDVLMKVINIILDHGAEVAFPTSTLHLASVPESPASS